MRRLLFVGLLLTTCCTSRPARVEQVQLITQDLDNFWAAYPAALRDTAQAYRIFQEQYFAKASPGLRDYYARKYQNDPVQFARRITQRPRYYTSIRQTTLAVAAQKPQILSAFRQLQALYPPARFSHIYFLVGGFAGSTAQPPGLLIGLDQTANGPGVDTSELTLVQRNRCGPITDLPSLITHEMVHNVQQRNDGMLLSAAIREGMADFVAELVTGTLGNNARLHAYGNAHAAALWRAFRQEMRGTDTHNWLANSAQETTEKPCDLGYYVGYKICQAYYTKSADKKQALATMLTTHDFPAFLARSGYAGISRTP
ncbi:DUF2268 domain-containing putative Zn-dependent protease [Hymenobacter canadensis]|uniref:DUF2268 domain-containing putative Zn-dependent protease n=1 Tax=Hymenobacter canadensis TaxID=2999067 RepID=A0ABY7LSB5_9BACT|nr:DUF2268 domain-containing putative Zn-dependent protease [Hymenobacter canadensis]WBA43311.1 DUF2268 domain-containing putative Zn-dependent protease [Hymenobacter canadensis]